MQQDTYATDVLFRVSRDDSRDVFALFPLMEEGRGLVACYQHVGQHSSADLQGCISSSRPAQPDEYADLARELTQIGYRLRVRKRSPSYTQRKRARQARS